MYLDHIEVRFLRNLTSVTLQPSPGLNLIIGDNASGKTSLLEAIYLLGYARSFRSSSKESLIQREAESFTLFAQLSHQGQNHRLGIQRSKQDGTTMRLDGRNLQTRATLATLLPLSLITPDSISLLTGAPSERRSYLDWLMFHVEHAFIQDYRQFNKYLKQRNALLRQGALNTLDTWTEGLIQYAERIDRYRQSAINLLKPHLQHFIQELLPNTSVDFHYRRGWNKELTLAQSMAENRDADIRLHYTTTGPQRADFVLRHAKRKVDEVLSRGQLKLLLCAMKLAQLSLLREQRHLVPAVLIDDLPAELDSRHRRQLLSLLKELDAQVFVTATSIELLDRSAWDEVKVFHVEHGQLKEVV